jgi:2-polyprenyl-3-methyl-5-hydroxy-6-metoxy-1,4-benzoquinol methylase
MTTKDAATEIKSGDRFAFGKNWSNYLNVVDENRIEEAMKSLQTMLGLERLDGMSFLDVGSGSGLFSLAAWRLGAKVYSFDFDPQSVATTLEMQRKYCNDSSNWHIEAGSVLDADYLAKLGQFDIVYSWGVLHHTGDMWQAIRNIIPLIKTKGKIFIALYNDQDLISKLWLKVKQISCSGLLGRILMIMIFFPYFAGMGLLGDMLRRKNPLERYTKYRKERGMSRYYDWLDWLGGYPFETAKPSDVFEFFSKQGFILTKLITRQSLGCNEFVFSRITCLPDTNAK